MITIFEGPDGSGKSTAAAQYADHLRTQPGAEVMTMHWGEVKKPLAQYLDLLATYHIRRRAMAEHGIDLHLVLDRFYFSEKVYGPVIRGEDRLAETGRMLKRVLLGEETLVVYCDPGYEIAFGNWYARHQEEQELVTLEAHYRAVYEGYQRLFFGNRPEWCAVLQFAYPHMEAVPLIESAAGQWARTLPNRGPGTGLFKPGNVLVVGESPGNMKLVFDPEGDFPFVSAKGCSAWLSSKLEASPHPIPETDLYWVNAFDRKGNPTDPSFVYELRPRKVALLGRRSAAWWSANLDDYPVDAQVFDHPQARRRFRPRDEYDFVTWLASITTPDLFTE